MKNVPIYKTIIAGLIFYCLLVALSFVFNMLMFAEAHEVFTSFRPEGHPLSSPLALAISGIFWSMLISYSYRICGRCVQIKNSIAKGAAYGAFVFLFFMWYPAVFYFQCIDFEVGILLGDLLTYGFVLPLGGIVIALFHETT